MEGYCNNCGKYVPVERVARHEVHNVKGLMVDIDATVCVCSYCKEEIWNRDVDGENLQKAYEAYRREKGLLLPKEIRAIREQYKLSQVAFARVLGMGDKTIARYENGSIQDEAHNNLLLLARNPNNFQELILRNKPSQEEMDRYMQNYKYSSSGLPIAYQTAIDVTGYNYRILNASENYSDAIGY